MSASSHSIREDQIDGVPVYWMDVPGPLSAALIFRVGRADEIPARYGITHLVEHLALAPLGVQDYEHNGGVESVRTVFEVAGSRADVARFLADVTHSLSALPTSRLLIERAIVRREADENGRAVGDALRGYRFGGVGFGATAEDEHGIHWLGEDLVREWADRNFNRQNAVLVLSGPPDDIRLDLPDGDRRPLAPPTSLPGLQLPSYVRWVAPAVALTYVTPRTPAANMIANILHRRMRARLRFDIGAVYDINFDYDRAGPDEAHVAFATETDERQTDRVLRLTLELIDELATKGPTPEELAYEVTSLKRNLELDDGRLGYMFEIAFDRLLGRPERDAEDLVRDREAISPEEARDMMRPALETLMAFGGVDNPAPDRLMTLSEWSSDEVQGETFAPSGFHIPGRGPKARLIVGQDGVTLRLSQTERLTVRYAELLAVIHEGDARQLVGSDAIRITIDAADWRNGQRAIALVDAATPAVAFACSSHAEGGLEDPEGRT